MRFVSSLASLAGSAGFFIAALAVGSTAGAVIVAPGTGSPLTGTTSAANPDLAGTVVNDNVIAWAITDGMGTTLVSGNLQNRVVRSDTLGTLIFAPRLTDIVYGALGPASSLSLSLGDYGAGTLDVDYRTDGLGEATFPVVVRSASGDTLFFPFVEGAPGFDSSLFLSILSTATDFGLTGLFTISATFGSATEGDGSPMTFSTAVGGLAVPGMGGSVIPLPAAAPLFLGALALGGAIRRRRRLV